MSEQKESVLTAGDIEDIEDALATPGRDWYVKDAVEAIVARHVAAALNEAADAINRRARGQQINLCATDGLTAVEWAADIVRNLAAERPPP